MNILCQTQTLMIPGHAGQIELMISCPTNPVANMPFGVICHPHPVYGGTMHNKVVYIIANTFNSLGAGVIRFNFRGVGKSEGHFDQGRGETEDLKAVVAWLRTQYAPKKLWLAGFSFGGYIAVRGHEAVQADRLLLVAPAVERFAPLQLTDIPCLIIQGGQDDVVTPIAVEKWAQQQTYSPTFKYLDEAEHFFHGKLNELRDLIKENWK